MKFDDALAHLIPTVGRCVDAQLAGRQTRCYVFDFRKLDTADWGEFLDDTFCDGFLDGYLDEGDEGTSWSHPTQIPFALAGYQGPEDSPFDGQFDAILLFDLAAANLEGCPVLAIEVDGTAMPEDLPAQVAARISDLAMTIDQRV